FRGTLTGKVTRPRGSGVPGAKVFAAQTETNTRSETVSGRDSTCTVPFSAPVFIRSVEANTGSRIRADRRACLGRGARGGEPDAKDFPDSRRAAPALSVPGLQSSEWAAVRRGQPDANLEGRCHHNRPGEFLARDSDGAACDALIL